MAPIFHGLPVVDAAREAPAVMVLAPVAAASASPARPAGARPILAAAALVVLCGVALAPGLLRNAAIPVLSPAVVASPPPAAARVLPVVEAPAAPVEAEPPPVLTPARLDEPAASPLLRVRGDRPVLHRAGTIQRRAPHRRARRLDWSVYERATRPRFSGPAGGRSSDTPSGLY